MGGLSPQRCDEAWPAIKNSHTVRAASSRPGKSGYGGGAHKRTWPFSYSGRAVCLEVIT